ncbi:glutamyl-tRNA(Gln) amidotransferase subunit C, mitochondrial-like [Haliotis rubra]|uniref:glutamyl-tRNA(Gln) amidotransferase subunit C, mitochondrial-like n=1 Tax=Haliotis rubra TaxID=36100 RepID=UPI001EE55FC4|nr:glutamyl-tRNA(Gln) amidotransferase subunit C, mitochondrial-like [Haliotis rubra]
MIRNSALLCQRCLRLSKPAKRRFASKVPENPTWIEIDPKKLPEVPKISKELVEQLERLSLVEFTNEEGIACLSAAIQSANILYMVNTDGVEPLDTVLENRELYLRNDDVTDGNCRDDILSNAVKTEEEYFVAPPGNIPLESKDEDYKKSLS